MKRIGIWSAVLLIIMILSLILSFPAVGNKAAAVLKTSGEVVTFWSRTVFATALGLWLISTGVAALAVPWVGITLIAIGVVLVAYSLWPVFKPANATGE